MRTHKLRGLSKDLLFMPDEYIIKTKSRTTHAERFIYLSAFIGIMIMAFLILGLVVLQIFGMTFNFDVDKKQTINIFEEQISKRTTIEEHPIEYKTVTNVVEKVVIGENETCEELDYKDGTTGIFCRSK